MDQSNQDLFSRRGATGMILCTSHAAMRPENLRAVGTTLRELKLA